MVLYRKYRPQKLSDLVGQNHVVEALVAQLESGRIGHGYLFSGPRGTGKTSTARILAKAVNCEEYSSNVNRKTSNVYGEPCNKCESCKSITSGSNLDLIEIDAASNRGIDEIRDLREKIKLSPVVGKFKVYIIDEVHMLTTEAFNALLKTLEEPPRHAIFILCTTEPNKLPATIISRLSRFSFKRAGRADIAKSLTKIVKSEKLEATPEGIEAIVKAADGSFRDALSILDQLSSTVQKIGDDEVTRVIRVSGFNLVYEFACLLVAGDLKKLTQKLEEVEDTLDLSAFNRELLLFFEKVMHIKLGILEAESVSGSESEKYLEIADKVDFGRLQNLMKGLLIAEGDMKIYPLPQISLLLAFCKLCPVFENHQESTREEGGSVIRKRRDDKPPGKKVESDELRVKADGRQPDKTESPKSLKGMTKTPVTLEDIKLRWNDFLGKVRPVNAHVVALLRSTRPIEIEDGTLYLEVFFRFHKEKLEEVKIMDLLCETLSDVMGNKLSLKFSLAQRTSKPTPSVSKSDVLDASGEDISRLAEEIFLK